MRKYEELMGDILQHAYDGMPGPTGQERADRVGQLLRTRLPEYAREFNRTDEQILNAWEKSRTCNVVNFYQESRFLPLDRVYIFDTTTALYNSNKSKKFICPACGKKSNSPIECDSEHVIHGARCAWKSYGLFGCNGKGVFVMVRELFDQYPYPLEMFRPADWDQDETKSFSVTSEN